MDEALMKYVPADSRQVTIEDILEKSLKLKNKTKKITVLDLGCGVGKSFYYFLKLNNNIEWTGIDIDDSPEILSRKDSDVKFTVFDGVNIPYPDNYFDVIYCKQVFEHVRFPEKLLKEIYRVLKTGGAFVGSTSHLEPYHSRSYFNYTPLGFVTILQTAKLTPVHLTASIDSITLILRRCLGRPAFFDTFWRKESPLNFLILILGKLLGFPGKKINLIKLIFCGQFIFHAEKQ